jgi:peptidylprolyl isomerase
MPIKNGDFVLVDYSLKVKDTNEVFDVTMEDQAKAANVYSPEQAYEPKLIVVGQGWMIKGIDEALLEADEGQEKDLEIAPAKAFGERDGSKVRIVPARELTKQGVTPRPGARIEVGGQLATIRSVGSGRVIVDYNHPLAGKTLVTKLYIRKVVSDPVERMRELIHRRIVNVKKDKFMISNLGTMVTVEMPEESFTLEDIQFAKKGIAKEIGKYFPEVATVQFVESHVLKQPEKVEAKPEEKKAEPAKEETKPTAKEETKPTAKEEPKETEKPAAKEGGRSRKKAQQRAQ